MALIAAQGLAIGVPGRVLARSISFAVGSGEILAVLGPNGAGKTTLFRTLLGLAPAPAGEALLAGDPVARLSRAEIARRLAYVPQAMTAPFPFAVGDFVLLGRVARLPRFGAPGRRDREAVARALAQLDLGRFARAPVTHLSGGERQLVLIARALAQEAPALLLDEPTAALDFGNRERFSRMLVRLAGEDLGLVFTTHDPAHAARLADRVLTIDAGGTVEIGPPDSQLSPERLGRLYDLDPADVLRAMHPPRHDRSATQREAPGASGATL